MPDNNDRDQQNIQQQHVDFLQPTNFRFSSSEIILIDRNSVIFRGFSVTSRPCCLKACSSSSLSMVMTSCSQRTTKSHIFGISKTDFATGFSIFCVGRRGIIMFCYFFQITGDLPPKWLVTEDYGDYKSHCRCWTIVEDDLVGFSQCRLVQTELGWR